MQHQPVLAVRIWLTLVGRLVARAVSEIEELSIEHGQSASVRAVQDDLPQDRGPSTGGAGISHVCDAARPAIFSASRVGDIPRTVSSAQ